MKLIYSELAVTDNQEFNVESMDPSVCASAGNTAAI